MTQRFDLHVCFSHSGPNYAPHRSVIQCALMALWIRTMKLTFTLLGCLLLNGIAGAAATSSAESDKVYEIVYGATLDPVTRRAQVRIALRQPTQLVRSIEFIAPRERYLDVRGQGQLDTTAEKVVWTPPPTGGVLHFDFVIEHRRADGALDARIADSGR